MNDEQRAMDAIRKVASIKAKPYIKKAEENTLKKLSQLGIEPDYLKYAAGTAKALEALKNQEIEGSVDISPNLELEGKMSPREKAIKLLYKKSF